MSYLIQILNSISPNGLKHFDPHAYQLQTECDSPDAILLRSQDIRDMEFSPTLKVVGRAGVGTNNIPIEKLTKQGIPVLNTPGANANAVKELVISGMLIASRNLNNALDYAKNLQGEDEHIHELIEKEKKQFRGFELPEKTLVVIGLGKIGVKVANAAYQLGMKVIGYDPSITVRSAWELSPNVNLTDSLNDALRQADFISLHVPLLDKTYHLIDHDRIQMMKPNVVLLNFARAEIVNNDALLRALAQNHIRTYVCDFPSAILQNNPKIISLPHLGASTFEAEENCAVMIVKQVRDYLELGHISNAVNFPDTVLPYQEGFRLTIINMNVPNMVAQISSVLSSQNINIIDMINKSRDKIAYTIVDVNNPLNDELLERIRGIEGVLRARKIEFS